ncbi:unnamed protein product [Lupinus luteus]|uniref:Uncharacterized protein n=1 Tax=Lupinus luteus TaxID=3873 RepID=A0AAV1YQ19_LUPLU
MSRRLFINRHAVRAPGWAPPTAWELTDSTCHMLLGSKRKLVMLSATGLSPSRMQHSTASPSSTTLV